MSTSNVNPETGIRYGIISANSLDPEIVQEIQLGEELHWREAVAELTCNILHGQETGAEGDPDVEDDIGLEVDRQIENLSDNWYDDEPVHEFSIDCPGYGPVIGQTTWLGGALMVWVFKSPFQEACDLCSPCVPNCGNLDSRNPDGYQCYDVPNDWRAEP